MRGSTASDDPSPMAHHLSMDGCLPTGFLAFKANPRTLTFATGAFATSPTTDSAEQERANDSHD